MRIVFAGTPAFAQVALEALISARLDVIAVLTQPDRPAGRGMQMQASAVKQRALSAKLEVLQPQGLKLDGRFAPEAYTVHQRLQALAPDVMVVVAYGLILPPSILAIPRYGCINIHASLLPRWRGAAPIQRALEAGDLETGVTIMRMDEGLDTGPMISAQKLGIHPAETAGSLHDRLALLGGQLIVPALTALATDQAILTPQPILDNPKQAPYYAAKIDKSEAALNVELPASQLARKIHAFNPSPGCTLRLGKETVKVWQATPLENILVDQHADSKKLPGDILKASNLGIDVLCGDGSVLRLTELQRPGAKPLPVSAFYPGWAASQGLKS